MSHILSSFSLYSNSWLKIRQSSILWKVQLSSQLSAYCSSLTNMFIIWSSRRIPSLHVRLWRVYWVSFECEKSRFGYTRSSRISVSNHKTYNYLVTFITPTDYKMYQQILCVTWLSWFSFHMPDSDVWTSVITYTGTIMLRSLIRYELNLEIQNLLC